MSERIASAVFDSREEAERALTELRSAGIREDSISIIGRHGEQDDTSRGIADDGEASEKAGDGAKGAIGGAIAGGLLGVAALAIPGVGPLAAAGAIASGAIPGAAAIGALFTPADTQRTVSQPTPTAVCVGRGESVGEGVGSPGRVVVC